MELLWILFKSSINPQEAMNFVSILCMDEQQEGEWSFYDNVNSTKHID